MSSTQFVEMYHPLIPSTEVTPARVSPQSIDEWAAKGWLLVDPDGVLPTPDTPYYTTAAADSRFAKVTDLDAPGTLTGDTLRAAFGALRPTAYFIATGRPNGTPGTADSGQALSIFGNSPLAISSGLLTHTPAAQANAAGYAQIDVGSDVVGAFAEPIFPAGSTGGIAIVLPLAAWANGSLSVAGVHFVMYGDGNWHVSNWTGSAEQIYAQGKCTAMLDGLPRRVELAVDRAASTLAVYLPDGTVASVTDSRVVSNTSRYAVAELYTDNSSGTATPARLKSWGAHGAADVVIPRNPASATRGDIAKAVAGRTRRINEHTASATGREVPKDCLGATITIIGPGGGGGSGRRGAAGTVRCGGGAGGSGGVINGQWIPRALLGNTYDVSISAPGAGGAAVTVDDTSGNSGAAPSPATTTFTSGTVALRAIGGAGGGGGTASAGTNGGAGAPLGVTGASASGTGGAGNSGALTTTGSPGAAGAGGGISSTDVPGAGGAGSAAYLWGNVTGGTGGVVGGAAPSQGPAASAGRPGDAPGGGAASITAAAQAGADGLGYGIGGGGGGASLNGNASGRGGNGGPGFVSVTFVYS